MGSTNSAELASRSQSSGGGTNNLPPLHFHYVHGTNIRISRDRSIARRYESFCKGITFSARSVRVNEKIYIRLLEISDNWSGVIRFGFTSEDPSTLRFALPKYACPDLTNKPGYWAKALVERFCVRGTILFYYVNSSGEVHFGINGEEKGIFFSGVDTQSPLWAMIDVYGNSTAIELVDVRRHLNNSRRNIASNNNTTTVTAAATTTTTGGSCCDVDRSIMPAMQAMSVHDDAPPLRYQSPHFAFNPVMWHITKGRNVRFANGRTVASRVDTEFCQGYVFTLLPLKLNERIVVQVLNTESMYTGSLALGLTSCDPSTLQAGDLPDDSDLLLDRPEYWVVSKDVARKPMRGDEIAFCVTDSGEVLISKNNSPPTVVMHVDQSLRLWAFLDIYGSTQSVRALSHHQQPQQRRQSQQLQHESMNSLNSQSELRQVHQVVPGNSRLCCADVVQVQPNGGAVLVVNLPPAHANVLNHQQQGGQTVTARLISSPPPPPPPQQQQQQPISVALSPPPPPPPLPPQSLQQQQQQQQQSIYSHTYAEPASCTSYPAQQSCSDNGLSMGTGIECTICYENPIDSVLYTCGHMCMCYNCAIQQWRGKGFGHCPLCRALIRDVIRTYKS